eukprot:5312617-Lingulodinium_polyedra.AAC.1
MDGSMDGWAIDSIDSIRPLNPFDPYGTNGSVRLVSIDFDPFLFDWIRVDRLDPFDLFHQFRYNSSRFKSFHIVSSRFNDASLCDRSINPSIRQWMRQSSVCASVHP